jgi:hypothetical protein
MTPEHQKHKKKSKVKLSFSDISDDKNSATNTSLCSGKSETLYDHGYSVSKDKSIDILASPTWPVDISETRKDIFFDHGYSSVSKDKDISVSPLPVENLLTMSESEKSDLTNKIDQQLTQLSKVGHSILFKNNPEELSERNWFRDVLDEMNRKCPELLEVLLRHKFYQLMESSPIYTISITLY